MAQPWLFNDLPQPERAEAEADLPESLRSLVTSGVSEDTVRLLVEKAGGLRVNVPVMGSHRVGQLAEMLGENAAELSRVCGGSNLYVPRCTAWLAASRNRALRADYDAGVSVHELCRKYKVTEPTVRRILADT
jgi:Mor family transcriptional regulator